MAKYPQRKNYEERKKKQRDYYNRLVNAVYALLGNECKRCGFSDRRALQIDHISGGGNKARKKYGVIGELKRILECGGEDYQILCANCNWIKRFTEDKDAKP